jgi:hypothetical protein
VDVSTIGTARVTDVARATDRRKHHSLSTPPLCQKALTYFFLILRGFHCPAGTPDYFAPFQAKVTAKLMEIEQRASGDVNPMHVVLKKMWTTFSSSIRQVARAAQQASAEAPHGSHVGAMMREQLEIFKEGAWVDSAVDKSRRRTLELMVSRSQTKLTQVETKLEKVSSELVQVKRTRQKGGAAGTGGGGNLTNSSPTKKQKGRRGKGQKRQLDDAEPSSGGRQSSTATGWQQVDLGSTSNRLKNGDAAKKAAFSQGLLSMDQARDAWIKASSENKGKCFWHHSAVGKAAGGCPFENCKFKDNGH